MQPGCRPPSRAPSPRRRRCREYEAGPPLQREAGLSACRRKGAGDAPPVPERFFASAAFRDGRRCRSARSASAARTAGACGAPVSARKKGPTVQPFRPADPAAQYSSEGGDCRTGSAVARKWGARRRNGRRAYSMRRAMPRRLRRCGRWRSPIRENRNLGFRFLHERRPGFERSRGAFHARSACGYSSRKSTFTCRWNASCNEM